MKYKHVETLVKMAKVDLRVTFHSLRETLPLPLEDDLVCDARG